jgi:hypothetical protein
VNGERDLGEWQGLIVERGAFGEVAGRTVAIVLPLLFFLSLGLAVPTLSFLVMFCS